MTTQELIREAEETIKAAKAGILIPHPANSAALINLIQRLLDVVKENWALVKIKDCGCEVRRSSKGNLFCDTCLECTQLP